MSTPSILIVEDEPKVASFIQKGLRESDYEAEVVGDGTVAVQQVRSKNYDLVLLDLNLPGMGGLKVCKEIRTFNATLPVLMLTALGTTDDKIGGFDSGADDYLVKPFEFRELLARIKALLKRNRKVGELEEVVKVADLELNPLRRKVVRDGKEIELTAKEFALLELLMRNTGKVISRTEIAEKIWDINFDTGTNVIDVYINFLRKKIDKNFPVKLIHTYIGSGYTLKEM